MRGAGELRLLGVEPVIGGIERLDELISTPSIPTSKGCWRIPPTRAFPTRTSAGNAQMEARIQSFELASRMQLEATEAFDISREPESVRRMYGDALWPSGGLDIDSARISA